jgi:hypothetical protein
MAQLLTHFGWMQWQKTSYLQISTAKLLISMFLRRCIARNYHNSQTNSTAIIQDNHKGTVGQREAITIHGSFMSNELLKKTPRSPQMRLLPNFPNKLL